MVTIITRLAALNNIKVRRGYTYKGSMYQSVHKRPDDFHATTLTILDKWWSLCQHRMAKGTKYFTELTAIDHYIKLLVRNIENSKDIISKRKLQSLASALGRIVNNLPKKTYAESMKNLDLYLNETAKLYIKT